MTEEANKITNDGLQSEPAGQAEAIVSLVIEATPDAVWTALTTSEGMANWMGEGSTIGAGVGADLLVDDIVTGRPKRGVVDEFSPARRLGYTWWPETAPDQATRVAITLTPCDAGTKVTVVESRCDQGTRAMASASSLAAVGTGAWAWRTALLALAATSLYAAVAAH